MEMEDQNHTNQYGIDLRQFISGRQTAHFPPPIPHQHPELFPGHRTLQAVVAAPPSSHHHHHYDLTMLVPRSGLHLHEFPGDSQGPVVTSATATLNIATTSTEGEGGCFGVGGGDIGGTGRWPRQETLTLLEIRSSLDSKFKEATQKGPLWEEVSRIMAEEHGYQRSGKKCREKFENLYKYYKKTKEGKAGRQDGKHYRFFRQLEALYGDTNPSSSTQDHGHFVGFNQAINPSSSSRPNTTTTNPLEVFHSHDHHVSLSLSNSSGYDTTSEEEDQSTATRRKRRGAGRRWKAKVKEFLDAQMRKLTERQEAWLERLTCALEEKEKERLRKEEEWMKREAERVDREHMFWAKEREWIEARDAALTEALQKLTGRDHDQHQASVSNSIPEGGNNISEKLVKEEGINKKRRENSNLNSHSRSSSYFIGTESMYHPGDGGGGGFSEINNNNGPSSLGIGSINGGNNVVSDSCFRFLMGGNLEGENLWENYGLKPSKGGDDHGRQ